MDKQLEEVEASRSMSDEEDAPNRRAGKLGGLDKKRNFSVRSDSRSQSSESLDISQGHDAMTADDRAFVQSYVNASHLNGLVEDFSRRSLIACMAPNENSLVRFWAMVWQQKVGMIVMLCPTVGPKGDESLDYWRGVNEKNRSAVIEGDGFKFRLTLVQQSQVNERIVRRRLKLQRDGYESESSPCFERCSAASQASDEGIVQP